MARAQLNVAIADLRVVVKEMRELGIASWANGPCGDVILGPEPHQVARIKKEAADPKAQRRTEYEELLGRKVSDKELENLP